MINDRPNFRTSERGSVAIEFAMLAMAAIVLFLGIIEFGRSLYIRNQLSYAMDLAARHILTDVNVTDEKVERVIRGAFSSGTTGNLQVMFGDEAVSGDAFRTVTIRYPITLLIPGLTSSSIMLAVKRRIPLG